METKYEPPGILNSNIKMVRIELPHYSFSHSSSGDSSHTFIGRVRLRKKLRKLVEDSSDKTGVYLVTGDRGVGKTNLVNEVIKETSLLLKTKFTENIKYLLLLLLAVVGTHVVTQFCLREFSNLENYRHIFWFILSFIPFLSFVLMCYSKGYSQKYFKKNIIIKIMDSIKFAFTEFCYLINPYNPDGKSQHILKIILVVYYTQIISFVSKIKIFKSVEERYISPTKAFVFYLCFVFAFIFWRFARDKLREYYRINKKYKNIKREIKDKSSEESIYNIENKGLIHFINCIFKCYTSLTLLFLPFIYVMGLWDAISFILKIVLMCIPFIMVIIIVCFWCFKYLDIKNLFKILFFDTILSPITNYIKNHNRLYLRINFGHKLKDDKDILRLITRTLSTEYNKYHRSFWRMLPWRIMAFSFLFIFAYLFSNYVEQNADEKSIINREYLETVSFTVDSKTKNTVENKVNFTIETKEENIKIFKIINPLHMLKCFAFKISDVAVSIPEYIFISKEKINLDNCKILRIIFLKDYLFWLSFVLMYLFSVLLFRSNWITHFFVTHRIIIKKLKKLNSDITNSTELENSINVNSGSVGAGIGTKTKKSRNVADAKEIEKELQDILDNMQQIPVIMCPPNIVIVFDELDKVEHGDTNLDKENLQTKASLFSINATRERQTEILRIMSNMKYFLSTASAKFIFIAGREMFDIHLADVSERNNYIGSIFNVVILVPSFLADHPTGEKGTPEESGIATLTEEFVCRRLFPHDYPVENYDLKNYRIYLESLIFNETTYKSVKSKKDKINAEENNLKRHFEEIQKIITVLQQFVIYLAHVSKGAPKKMMQLFESFVEIRETGRNRRSRPLAIYRYHSSLYFLTFNYYKQYTLGIIAYLITPIFYRLEESYIKEHSDKLLVSSLRFVDFLFKFHKHSFSWKHLDISPEMLEVNRAPELKSVAVDLVNYLIQVHINKSSFSLSDYKFNSWIANEIFAMAKTDEVFSALFSFSLDETLPLKKYYQDLLENTKKEYQNVKDSSVFIDAISSLQVVLGDLYYYDDELEEAEVYYKNAVQALREKKDNGKLEKLYVYVRNMLRLGIIYDKRKQYDFAYLTYNELCKRILQEFTTTTENGNGILFTEMAYDGLKVLYLPFLAKLQILEKSHIDGITRKQLEQLDKDFIELLPDENNDNIKHFKSEFYSSVADILYYKNSDLKKLKCKENIKNCSCTACYYYHKALSILLGKPDLDKAENKGENTVIKLLSASINQLKNNYNMKYCTILSRILSDWGNVFFSCDAKDKESDCGCYLCDEKYFNIILNEGTNDIIDNCIKYLESEKEESKFLSLKTKKDVAFAMYSISSVSYRNANLYKCSSYQIYKTISLFKQYSIYNKDYIDQLSKQAIHYLLYANENLNVPELNKQKKDFDKVPINKKISLKNILVDSEITQIRILVKELELKSDLTSQKLKDYYTLRITSPYKINYSIGARIYQLRIKTIINYEVYRQLLKNSGIPEDRLKEKRFILEDKDYNVLKSDNYKETAKNIFGKHFNRKKEEINTIEVFENLITDSIYCLTDISQLSETMEETFVFPHSFLGSVHEHLSFWIRQFEAYEVYKKQNQQTNNDSKIEEILEKYLGEEWREQLSGYRENQRALSHYYKCLEMHSEGRAYQNMLDIMVYVKDDFNDRSDHFNIAEERHLIVNGKIDKKINDIKDIYKDSKLYYVDNYFNEV